MLDGISRNSLDVKQSGPRELKMQSNGANSEQPAGWRLMLRQRWVKIAGAILALIVLALIVTPFFVNADTFRPMVESELSNELGRKVTIGHLSYSVFSGGLVAKNVAIADDPRFSAAPFFQVQSMRIGVNAVAFLFHHALHIHSFQANSPQIRLISAPNGTWNYASLGGGESVPASAPSSSPSASPSPGIVPNILVGIFRIRNGSVLVSSLTGGQPFICSDVNLTVKDLSWTKTMPFTLAARLPGDGSLTLTGTAGPINRHDDAATPFQASLVVKHFSPVAAGILPASEGVSMLADVNAQLASTGATLTSNGKLQAADLVLSRSGSPAPQPVNMTYNVTDDLTTHTGQLQDLTIQTGSAAAHVTGSFQTSGSSATLDLHLNAPNLPIDQLETLLPSMGIRLPKGSRLQGGTLNATLQIAGTASAPVVTGPVEIDNTRLTGFDLSHRIMGLNPLHDLGNDTEIQTLRAQVKSTVTQTGLTDIDASVPSIGTATGNGTVSSAGALDFHLTAKLGGAVGGMVKGAAKVLGGVGAALAGNAASDGIPVTITGTSSDPVIRANIAGMLTGQTGQKKKGGLLKSLFGH